MMLDPGHVLQDRYRVVTLLGEGGMGAVYRAWDMRLGVAVALKEMRPEPGLDPARLLEAREQFHQEASVLSRLDHPHLVRVSDFFDEEGSTYLVMAFVVGENLADYIGRTGPLPETQVLAWADQLLDALAYCHREGVLHRDIKPQNVIVRQGTDVRQQPGVRRQPGEDQASDVVLVDFGLVKLWDPADPRTRTVIRSMGTPQYAPPEQYDPHMGHTDPRSDLYSLGATLYHALTGQVPPTATTRIVNPGALVPARQFNADVSLEVERALDRALALQPVARFQTATDMRYALGALRDARAPAPDRAEVLPEFRVAPVRRFPLGLTGALLVALLICVVVVATTAGVTYWLTQGRRAGAGAVQPGNAEPIADLLVEGHDATGTPSSPGPATPTPESEAPQASTVTPTPTVEPSSTPTPTPTLVPSATPAPSCPEITGPFAGVWRANRDALGCATGSVYESWIAQERFERGMMTWREDNGRIYAHYSNGAWASYADLWSEGDPDYSCGTPSSPPTPIRGFGKIWCTYDAVRSGLGNATGIEVGQTARLQMFEQGHALQSQSGDIYIFLNSGRWWVQ